MTPPGFCGSPLDRLDALRHDPDAIARLAADPAARLLRWHDYVPDVDGDGGLVWTGLAADKADRALLGLLDGVPRFVDIPSPAPPARRGPALFEAVAMLRAGEAATYATARSLADWHARHHFCAACGHATGLFRAGWGRLCPACGTEHFPRTDPVVIMLAEHRGARGRRVLLGRQPAFPPGRYSALAGFLEVGESIEDAVRRELGEEAGLRIGAVRYVASQPWPFPSSLMIACVAEAPDDQVTLDRTELEDAFWATPDNVALALTAGAGARFVAPPPYAIAHSLLTHWLAAA